MTFFDIAKPMAMRGVPQIRIRPNSKAAFDKDWPSMATTNLQRLAELSAELPDCNGASVAQARIGGFWMLEVDSPEVIKRIEAETEQQIPDTFRVRSRPGRGHFYWKHTSASIAAGNSSQAYVKNGDFSVRANNQYTVSAKSIHPHSQQPYVVLREEDEIIECPDWLVAWLSSQRIEKKIENVEIKKNERGLIEHGFIHGWLVSEAGRMRHSGLTIEEIETILLRKAHEQCAPPLDDNKIKQVARSFAAYPPGQNTDLLLTQNAQPVTQIAEVEPEELPTFNDEPYPKFPHFVMESTSLYENFVRPICAVNSRIPYFMWLPAMQLLLNYIGPKVKIKEALGPRPFRGSIYTVIIGRKGKTNKSSSVQDAMSYFNYCGLLQHAGRDVKNADGKILTWTAGSPEGLGLDMMKTGCKSAVLFYDELSQLVSKAGIESSALATSLLTMYEAGKFSNSIKSTKETYSLDPDTYCTSLIACTTDKKFHDLWSRLAGADTGLNDRFFFVLQPEVLPAPKLQVYVNTVMGSIETKKLIDKAIQKGEYAFESTVPLEELVAIENRYANRAEKWALALAIDLGLEEIDGECVERAVAIVKYEIAVKSYLKSYESLTREGQIQQEIRRNLELAKGRLPKRDLLRQLNYDRYGTTLWNQAYYGLIKASIIREEGGGTRSNPAFVQLLQKREVFDD